MLTFIVNPTAGNGYALKIEQQVQAEMARRGLLASSCIRSILAMPPIWPRQLRQQSAAPA